MYKLREARLKEYYINEMDTKAPITSRHGESMADHSFESLKSKEIRGTDSPTRDAMKFGHISSDAGGWNVISSTETSDDGKARTEKVLATTEGVTAIQGGKKAFSGKNEELKTERYDGDANNFTYSTGETSNMVLNENVVTGDDSSKRFESKSSSVSHSTKVIRSSANSDDTAAAPDSSFSKRFIDESTDNTSSSQQNIKQTSSNIQSETTSETKRASDIKLSQDSATVQEAFRLAQQPGNIISRIVERANPTTNIIIEKKELTDGTIVTTKRYENIKAEQVDIQATTKSIRDEQATSNRNIESQETKKTTQQQVFKTARDEEAFRLSQQPGKILSRNVEMTDANTRMITEKKELHDGTVVTTKRYENIKDDSSKEIKSNVKIVRENIDTQSSKFLDDSKTSNVTEKITKTTQNETFKTARDEEAFRLAQQPGKIISRNVEMANPTTRMITEKKELTDGTVVTTKRYENISSDSSYDKSVKTDHETRSVSRDSNKFEDNVKVSQNISQTFKTPRDEEAFRLAQQPGKIISRNVEMATPTTRMITEKKELTDGTVVTTKRYENISSDTSYDKSVKTDHETRSVSRDSNKFEDNVKVSQNISQTFKTPRDEEAFRLAQQPGKIISRNVEMANPTTRMITEKKELTDGTVVTTKRFESVTSDLSDVKTINRENIASKNITTSSKDVKKSFQDDKSTDKKSEIVEETITKKIYDTSCQCPSIDKHMQTKDFVDKERTSYDIPSDIVITVDRNVPTSKTHLIEVETIHDESIRKENLRRAEENIVKEQLKREQQPVISTKITRELEQDAAHRAFASSLRCVTPPNERVSTPMGSKLDNRMVRSPSRDTTTSKISSSTTTIRKPSDARKHDDYTRPTQSSDRRSSTKSVSPDKQTKVIVETIDVDSKPERQPQSPKKTPQTVSKPQTPSSESEPSKTYPTVPKSRESSPQKPVTNITRSVSPQKPSPANKISPRDISPTKPSLLVTNVIDDNQVLKTSITIDNKDKTIKDDLTVTQTVDLKNVSATTSVSDLEYIPSDDRKIVTDLDGDEHLEIKINLQNIKQVEDLQIDTNITEVTDDKTSPQKQPKKKPVDKKQLSRSETFEERARKLIGVQSDVDDDIPSYAKPTKASLPTTKPTTISRVSEIRERKAKIEKETQEIEKVASHKKKSITTTTTDFITQEKLDDKQPSQRPTTQSPTRQPTDGKHPETIKSKDQTKIIPQKTNLTKPERNVETKTYEISKLIKSERSPVRPKSPETHISVAKINITPANVTTIKTSKVKPADVTKPTKVAPNIKLVKRPLTDISSTEPETTDQETDQELIKNIDKSTGKSTRKKLLQSRKDSAPIMKTETVEKEKITRSTSENVFKTDTSSLKKKTSSRSSTKESSPKKDTKRPVKCVTTKSINLSNLKTADTTKTMKSNQLDEIIIDVQHAKSSREQSPNKMIPIPVKPDEHINGESTIYPDKITEPDDATIKQKPKVTNIPIFEEQTKQFVGLEITEIGTEQSETILEEEEIDESERSIINSFNLEKADRKRNSIQVDALDDDDEDQTHLINVSEKTNKFKTTTEEYRTTKPSAPARRDEIHIEDISEPEDESLLSVNQKVRKFTTTSDDSTIKKETKKFVEETMSRSLDEVDEELRDDQCLLSVSDKVNKFISSAEKLVSSTPQKSPELVKNVMKQTTKGKSDETSEDVQSSSLVREKISTLTKEDVATSRTSASDITLKSTEAVKRAREIFEKNAKPSRNVSRPSDIISRPSVWEGKRTPTSDRKFKDSAPTTSPMKHEDLPDDESRKIPSYKDSVLASKSPSRERQPSSPVKDSPIDTKSSSRRGSSEKTPVYMKDQVSTKKDLFEKRISSSKLEQEFLRKSLSPQSSVDESKHQRGMSEEIEHQDSITTRRVSSDKHYMSHTVASLEHVNTERRDTELYRTTRRESETRSESKSPTKFHRNASESTTDSIAYDAPRSPTKFGVELKHNEAINKNVQSTRKISTGNETINIEEIFDLSELERLLEIVVGYEQRRKIRTQIRIVKKIISDQKSSIDSKYSSKTERVTSSKSTTPSRKLRDEPVMQTKIVQSKISVDKSDKVPQNKSRVERISTTTIKSTAEKSFDEPKLSHIKTTRVVTEKSSTVPSTQQKITETSSKNIKGKTTESVTKTIRKTSATSGTRKVNESRETKTETDSITSSYGVGPTDSNGLPLFGLKALRKKSPLVTESKTTGSVTSEVSYSKNGAPAVVERSSMQYSTDPNDFGNEIDMDFKTTTDERKSSRGGIYSVTKVEKFIDNEKASSQSVPSSKVIRRGSVKELKEKFVRKDSMTKKTKSSSKTETKRSSVDYHESGSEIDSQNVSNYYTTSSESKSFLNSDKKASNVQEVITLMRNADDVQMEGDTTSDKEARALLNKFLGATALMTTIENTSGLSKEFLSKGSSSKKQNAPTASKSRVTKTVTSYSTAKSYDINDIWDVDLLKKLLESTTNTEERRKIRARLQQVMADKEETMTKTSSEVQQKGDKIIKTTTTEVITKSTMQPQQKMSPFAKFRQLDRQNSLPNSPSPKTPLTPTTPGGSKTNGPLFTFTDPALQRKAATVKDQLLQWCQMKTKEFENIEIVNFSSSWSDGLAFCALINHFLPDAFDYSKLTPKERRHNFNLAFQIAEEKAGIAPLLDVDDMVMYKKPDWKCVFCYVQSIYRRFKNED